MRRSNHSHFYCLLLLLLCQIQLRADRPGEVTVLMDKVTFRVDMRLQSVNGTAYIAGSFMDQVGLSNWTEVAMCDLGSGIYEISFTGIAPGTYQYKFLNGPGGWEFNGFGGPCTNPLDNNNRWLNYGGGLHVEGPWCFSTCDLFCAGLGDPGVSDTDPPTIDEPAPANTSVACGDPLPAASPLLASDGCDYNATTSTGPPTDDSSGLGACGTGNVIRTWEAEDCAGNTATVSQTITITDNIAPVINAPIPANVTVACGSLPPAVSLPASDGCDAAVTTTGMPTDDNSGLNACGTGQVVRTWEVSDCAGNSFSASQTITVVDNTDPVITGTVPADVTVACGNVPVAAALTASDACDTGVNSTGPPVDDNSGLGACGTGMITRTWEVSDCAGNTVSASQTITIEDNTAPVLQTPAPADVTVACGNIPAAAPLAASDACDAGVTTTGPPVDDNSGLGACGTGQIIRTWEVSDCSGNSFSASQTITVEDTEGPSITEPVPAGTAIECGDPIPVGMPLLAADACDANVTATNAPVDDWSNVGPCGTGQITRTWEVSDCAGNTTTVSQLITIEDTTQPVITEPVPANTSVSCSGIPPGLPLSALDGCDGSLLATDVPNDDFSGLNSCGLGTVVRTWTATDCNGNSVMASQLITIEDVLPPVITDPIPADVTVTCGNIPAAVPLAAADDCDAALVATGLPVDDVSGLNGCGVGTIVRTWTATDCSGNSFFDNQVITVEDNEPPVLTIPADASFDCANIPTASAADATATDNCSTATVAYDGETIAGSGCPYEIHRTWSATDECGNVGTATQIITVTDQEPPVFVSPPPNVTVCQGALPAMIDLDWTDNCDGMGSVSPTDVSDGMSDPETITRTWTQTDNCGNTASVSQIITVISAPSANAGPDQSLCEGQTASLSGNVSGGFNSLLWTTSGDGTFLNATDQQTTYTPGTGDLSAGAATIYFTAQTNGVGACSQTSDSLQLTLVVSPAANVGAAPTITCASPQVTLDGSGSSSGNGFAYEWTGPGIHAGNANEQNPQVDQPGSYNLVVTETGSGQNCSASTTVEVLENTTPPTADAGSDLTLTCTETSVTLQGSGSAAGGNVDYRWTGPGITAANQNLPDPQVSEGGIYTLTVTDMANGCTATDSVTVFLDGNLPTADAGPDQLLTCLVDSVSLDGSNSSAGPGIIYQWFDPDGQPLGNEVVQTVFQEGIYTLNVNDINNGCSLNATVEVILDRILPIANAGPDTSLTCDLASVVLGGNSSTGNAYAYEWTLAGMVVSDQPTFTTSQSGLFTLTVTNTMNGCLASDQVEVSQQADVPTADAGPDRQLDCGSTSVTLDGTGSSTGPGITYSWVGPGFSSGQVNPQVSAPGIYYLTVTNTSSACSNVDSVVVTTDASLPVALAGPDTVITCFAPQILLDGSGSSQGSDLEYQWQNNNGDSLANTLTFSVGQSGTYTLLIINTQNGCAATDEVTVGQDTLPPVVSAGPDGQLTCTQNTIVLDGSGSSAGLAFSYLWTGPGLVGDATLSVATAATVGTYILTVTNLENGCAASDEVNVSQNPDVPAALADVSGAITCLVQTVMLSGSASVPNATYTWSGPGIQAANINQQNPVVSEPGLYSLIVQDPATGCDSPPVFVEVLDLRELPAAAILAGDSLDCQTDAVLLDGSASSQGDTISYQWFYEGQFAGSGPDAVWLAENAGTYELLVLNTVTGCEAVDSVEVVDVSAFPPAMIEGPTLLNCSTPTLTLAEMTGSVLPDVSLVWFTAGGHILQQNQNEIIVDAAGQYTVEVTDLSNGCVSLDTISITEDTAAPAIVFNQSFSLGCGQSAVMLEAEVLAGTTNLQYEWSGSGWTSSEVSPVVEQAGVYNLVVTNQENGCSGTASVTVGQSSGIGNVFFTATPPTCFGEADGILQIDSVAGMNPPYTFILGNGAVTETPLFTGLSAGNYTLLTLDATGCEQESVFTLDQPGLLTVDLGGDQEIALGEAVVLTPVLSAPVTRYIWTNAATLSCSDCPEPTAQPSATTLYSLTVSNDAGCSATDDIWLVVNREVAIFPPNAFSPNADGLNDVFTLFGGPQVVNINRLLVFDRWGAKVYDGQNLPPNDVSYGWDGRHQGQLMDAGVYVFYAEIALTNEEVLRVEGEVLLIR